MKGIFGQGSDWCKYVGRNNRKMCEDNNITGGFCKWENKKGKGEKRCMKNKEAIGEYKRQLELQTDQSLSDPTRAALANQVERVGKLQRGISDASSIADDSTVADDSDVEGLGETDWTDFEFFPDGWRIDYNEDHEKYYVNEYTGESQWDKPTKEAPPLPDGWSFEYDEASGKIYYVNGHNGETQWEVPTEPATEQLSRVASNTSSIADDDDDASSIADDSEVGDLGDLEDFVDNNWSTYQ